MPGSTLGTVQLWSHVQLFATSWTTTCQSFLSFPISLSVSFTVSLRSTKLRMPSNHLILCHHLLSPGGGHHLLPSVFPSISVFSNELALHIRWPKYWSYSFSISPSNEYSGLMSSRIDRFDFLAVQGTLKCLLQHHSLKASILWHSAFFIVQLSHPYMTTGKTIALTIWTLAKWCLFFNMLSRFVIAFLPKNKHLLISWLQSPSAVILEPKKIKSVTVSTFFPTGCLKVKEPDAMILDFSMLSFKPGFSLPSFTLIRRLFSFSHFLPLGWCHISEYWYFF